MATKPIVITDEGLKKITDDLEYLKNVKRKEIIEAISKARAFGDLSENSEYDEAREEQSQVELRIKELEELLRHAKVISDDDVHTDSVNVGARVKVYDFSRDEEIEYSIVGSTEADPINRKLSDQSPIGSALIGAKQDEIVTAATPGGELKFKIIEISK
ncbi:MAG: transcription elongation factor GreA [Eubacteriales bacterium]|jgi:transcription elongation factor GreA|nr:transcription elongation factor GreA [Eubacteriales bacterium]